jgi:WXG100 family type VII secretion target
MSTIAGSLEQLEALSRQFAQQGQAVDQLTSTIRGQLDNALWQGPAADRFRSTWSSEFEPVLRKLQAGLQEAGTEVQRRKDALQTAGS